MTGIDDPAALRNLKKGDSPGAISGLDFLLKYHKSSTRFRQGNEGHPLRLQEQADTRAWLAARQPVENVQILDAAPAKVKKKRIKRAVPKPDADGKFRL